MFLRLRSLLLFCLISLVLPMTDSLAAEAGASATGQIQISSNAALPLDPEDPLNKWFNEQDQLLEVILMRLARIELMVKDIHRLLMQLPDAGGSPASPQGLAPSSPLPSPPGDESMAAYLGGGLAGALLLIYLLWRRSRPMQPLPLPVTEPSAAAEEADESQTIATHAAPAPAPPPPVPERDTFLADQALELVDILLSMGMDDSAAGTLLEQIEREPKQALQHWLKLLEIYRQTGKQAEFESFAGQLRQHFNVQADAWHPETDAQRPLEDYGHVFKEITRLWPRRAECRSYMETLLRDNRGGSRSGLSQQAAEEMLLLIHIASIG